MKTNIPCPCGTDLPYFKCCEKYIRGKELPLTAELLMRSRYTAYVIGAVDYLIETRHPQFRTPNEAKHIAEWMSQVTSWDKLEVLIAEKGEKSDTQGWVGFNVFFHQGGQSESFYEWSRFSKLNGRWVYEVGE
jgi:SEC-C motif-containing protein